MSKSTKREERYDTARLLRSNALAGYQPDFARAILTEKQYTITEAKAAIDAALERGAKEDGGWNLDIAE
ncbi:MAG: hypothetical protein IKF99_10050 [Oscillospiraceae bacterium]|nr:hypothetical protein [Oscillospiraceae bacterium]